MDRTEYDKMVATGAVQEPSSGGGTYILLKGPDNFRKQAPPGSLYVEFDIPLKTTLTITEATMGWARIESSTSLKGRLAKMKGLPIPQLPQATNIQIVEVKP